MFTFKTAVRGLDAIMNVINRDNVMISKVMNYCLMHFINVTSCIINDQCPLNWSMTKAHLIRIKYHITMFLYTEILKDTNENQIAADKSERHQ